MSWDSRVLQIEASNSSLEQILRQVAANTGAKLEGLTHDERIFGTYGPGPACDVLSELLEGSGYNVLMVGSHDTDAPLRIVLSARLPPSPQTAMSNRNRNSPDSADSAPPDRQPDYSAQTHPQQNQNPFANGESPRDPVKFMDEILHRQQRIDEQQEQQKQQQEQQNNLLQ